MNTTAWLYVVMALLILSITINIFMWDFIIYMNGILKKLEIDLMVKDDPC